MIRSTFLFCFLVATITQVTAQLGLDAVAHDELWSRWKSVHQKQYADHHEERRRRGTWMNNVAQIMHHNTKHDLGLVSYSMGLNQFADLSWEEFRERHLSGLLNTAANAHGGGVPFNASKVTVVADSVDWRQQGLVRSVKNQGDCGSCWAFSTTGAVEGQYARQYGKQLEFSEQQLVDCSVLYGNHGCRGGLMELAFQYLEHFGLEPENVYPYHAHDERCHFDRSATVVMVKSYDTVHTGNEQLLKAMVSSRGPTSVGVDADEGFQFYRAGVYQSRRCSSTRLNHGVLAVGYGSDGVMPYWIVKNSWGADWGEAGYIRLARNHGNMCGIATMASVPRLA